MDFITTVEELIEMKNRPMLPFPSKYKWLFNNIEDLLISKSNGEKQVEALLKDFDEIAKLYIVHQFVKAPSKFIDVAEIIIKIFKIDVGVVLEQKYYDELLDSKDLYNLIK